MNLGILQYIAYFSLPFSLSLIITPLVRILALRSGFVSYPRPDRWNKAPTALLGGIGIYLSFMISVLAFGLINKATLGLMTGATFLFIIGLLDDHWHLSPYFKLFCQIIAGSIVILTGTIIGLPISPLLSMPLTLIWIIGVTNAFNLLDNIDGLAGGVAAISAFILFLNSQFIISNPLGILALVLCCATLGFIPYNFNPAKIFMGDSGSMFLGYCLSVISISSTASHVSNLILTMIMPVLVLSVPIFDTIFVMVIRKIQGKKIFEGGKDHTSHHLVTLGLSPKKAVLLFYAISFIFGIITVLYLKVNVFIISAIAFLGAVILMYFGIFLFEGLAAKKAMPAAGCPAQKQDKLILNNIFLHKRRIIEVLLDFALICLAYYGAYFIRFESENLGPNLFLIKQSLVWIIVLKIGVFFTFGLYRGTWRYISIPDFFSIFKVVSLGSVVSILFLTFVFRFKEYSRTVFFLDWLLLLFLITGSRFLFRIIGEFFSAANKEAKKVLIFGAGDTGEMVIREIKRNKSLNYRPVGFIDDDAGKMGSKIQGYPVLGQRNKMRDLISRFRVNELIVAVPSLSPRDLTEIAKACGDCGVTFKKVKRLFDESENDRIGKN